MNTMHKMKLLPEYFDKIRVGSKCVEMRLLDEKRRLIKIGDTIEFSRSDGQGKPIVCLVKDLKHFDNFLSLANYYPARALGFDEKLSADDIARYMYGIYCECTVNRCSALAIEIERFDFGE